MGSSVDAMIMSEAGQLAPFFLQGSDHRRRQWNFCVYLFHIYRNLHQGSITGEEKENGKRYKVLKGPNLQLFGEKDLIIWI